MLRRQNTHRLTKKFTSKKILNGKRVSKQIRNSLKNSKFLDHMNSSLVNLIKSVLKKIEY